jgi:hypothetical protein
MQDVLVDESWAVGMVAAVMVGLVDIHIVDFGGDAQLDVVIVVAILAGVELAVQSLVEVASGEVITKRECKPRFHSLLVRIL